MNKTRLSMATNTAIASMSNSQTYEASSSGRRLGNWSAPEISATSAAVQNIRVIRNRSHDAVRNNQWIQRSIAIDTANVIGTGIVPRATTHNEVFNTEINELISDYVFECDYAGSLTLFGIQALAVNARKEDGECFIRIVRSRNDTQSVLPLSFQILESHFCPTGYNKKLSNGGEIKSGVEINVRGQIVAYWIYPSDPLDKGVSFNSLVRVLKRDIIHHYKQERPGQLRGVPETVRALVKSHLFDQYDDAELERKKSRAQFTGVIRRPDYGKEDYKFDPISGEPIEEDSNGVPIIDMETGTFPSLLPGEEITLFEGDDAGRGYKDFQSYQLLGIAASMGVPVSLMSGDFSNINDRVWRAIMNQYHREKDSEQDLLIIPQVCRPMYIAIVERAILSGRITFPQDYNGNERKYLKVKHSPQAYKYIHPVQDVQAKKLEVDSGFRSRQSVVDESRGERVEDVDQERASDAKREEELNLTNNNDGM